MTKPKAGGYNFRQMVSQALTANREGRGLFDRALREEAGSQAMNLLLYRALAKFHESYEATLEIQRTWRNDENGNLPSV